MYFHLRKLIFFSETLFIFLKKRYNVRENDQNFQNRFLERYSYGSYHNCYT